MIQSLETGSEALLFRRRYIVKSNAVIRSKTRTQILVYAGLLIAISIVLKILFEVYIPLGGFPSLRINLNSIPIILGGLLLGPLPGFAIGVISDLLCFIIKPNGPWFFGFTLSSGLTGLIPGLLWPYLKNRKLKGLKWINVIFSLGAVAFLLASNTISVSGSQVYYLDEPLNPFILILFIILVAVFAIYPFIAVRLLKYAEAEESENLLVVITIEQLLNSVFLNTLWLTMLYGQAWMVLLPGRVITNIFLIPMYTLIIAAILRILPEKYKR